MLLLEESNDCVSNDLKIYLNDHNVDTLCLAARCVDEYTITHKDTHISSPPKVSETKIQHLTDSVPKASIRTMQSSNIKSNFKPLSPPTCTYYTKREHTISECFSLKRNQ